MALARAISAADELGIGFAVFRDLVPEFDLRLDPVRMPDMYVTDTL